MPTFAKIIKLLKQLGANIIAVDCPCVRVKGQLGLLQYPDPFSVRNSGPYNPPTQQPPTYPIITDGTSTADWERLCVETTESQWHWQTYKHFDHIYIKQMAKAIEPVCYVELDDPDKGLNGINIRTFLSLILY